MKGRSAIDSVWGEQDSAEVAARPLSDLRVIEFAAFGPVPYAGMHFADLGARIIRVDRVAPSGAVVGWRGAASSPWRDVMARGRRSISLNVKAAEGHAIVLALAEQADVLLEGFRPGVMERLGLGPDELLNDNPHLVYARASGFNRSSHYRDRAGHDLNFLAMSGALYPIGFGDRPPPPPSNYVADFGGGALFATGILAAIVERSRSGRGQVVDLSLLAASASMTSMLQGQLQAGLLREGRGANELDGAAPYYRCYETEDGKYLAVAAIEPQFYERFLGVLGISAEVWPQSDAESWQQLSLIIEEQIRTRTRQKWLDVFGQVDACVSPVLTPIEATNWLGLEDLFVNRDGVNVPAPTPRLSATPGRLASAPPEPGQDTGAVLHALGFSHQDIQEFRARGVA